MTSVQSPVTESSTFARRSTFISHFTPSLMTPEVLETIFTGRHKLLEKLVGYCRSSVLTSGKQFTLLVGPRGFGKTHLIALTYYRLKAQEDLQDKMLLAWMREEEWGITSFLDFLLRVFRALQEEYSNLVPEEELDALYGFSPAEAEARAAELLKEVAGRRTIVLLLENLDDIFAGLGDNGQKRLRAYLQENNFISILATSPSLFNGISRRTSPFFGSFRILHLDPMTFEEAVSLLERLARLRGDDELADFIPTPTGRARVRAIHHLSGGNYRVYVIFSQFLTRESLDELVGPLLNMLDELTPYYQSRMQLLSPQQRKIIEYLVDYRAAAPVKSIAQRGFMSPQSASSQLSDLQVKGYVRSESQGRESFYELREPLMRLCMEVKKERGETIGLFVRFLRIWYSKGEVQKRLEEIGSLQMVERLYLMRALELFNAESEDPKIVACLMDFDKSIRLQQWETAQSVAEELYALDGSYDSIAKLARALFSGGRQIDALNTLHSFAINNTGEVGHLALMAEILFSIEYGLIPRALTVAAEFWTQLASTKSPNVLKYFFDNPLSFILIGVNDLDDFVSNRCFNSIAKYYDQDSDQSPFFTSILMASFHLCYFYHKSKTDKIKRWEVTWTNVLSKYEIHQKPLRFVQAIARHFLGDNKALLSLPLEERQLVRDIIDPIIELHNLKDSKSTLTLV